MISYLNELLQMFRWQLAKVICLKFFAAFFESAAFFFFIPLLALTHISTSMSNGKLSRAYDWLLQHHIKLTAGEILLFFVITFVLTTLLNLPASTLSSKIESEFASYARAKLYKNFIYAKWLYLQTHHKGKLSELLTFETSRLGYLTQQVILFATAIISTMVYIFLSFFVSWQATLIILIIASLVFILRKGQRFKAYNNGKRLQQSWQKLQECVQEHLLGIKVAKCFGTEESHFQQFSKLSQLVLQQETKCQEDGVRTHINYQITSMIMLAGSFYIILYIFHQSLLSTIVLFFVFLRIFPMLASLQRSYHYIINLLPSYDVLRDIQTEAERHTEMLHQKDKNFSFKHHIIFEEVSFTYDHKAILSGINFLIPTKSFTIITGYSGVGKSTLADLLSGLMLPTTGRILIDDCALDENNYLSWRKNIAFVTQETFFFNDTIESNLKLVNTTATQEEIDNALTLAQANTFVKTFPQGLQTVIGDSGIKLSGGEQQRLALARAILSKPKLLILDEVTSFLDARNAQCVLSALINLKRYITIVLITHQTTAMVYADQIFTLEQGPLVVTKNGVLPHVLPI